MTGSVVEVLILFSSSEIGGAERSLTRMAAASGDGSVIFTLATLDGPGPWSEWCREQGLEAHVLGKRSRAGGHGRFGAQALFELVRLVRKRQFDAIYVVGLRAAAAVRLMIPVLKGTAVVHAVRWNPASAAFLDRAFRAAERLLQRYVALYICNSQAAAETLIRRIGVETKKINVIYNGLSLPPLRPREKMERPMQVVTVANLSPRKGCLEYLERVVAPLAAVRPDMRVRIAGRDEMGGEVQRKAAALGLREVVEFPGFMDDVSPLLAAARVFVLPSLWGEGCPTSVLEAMAHSVPVVAFAVDGVPELVEDGVDGFLVSPGDYVGMRARIERVLGDETLAVRLGAAGREKVERRFTLEVCRRAHEAVFHRLVTVRR